MQNLKQNQMKIFLQFFKLGISVLQQKLASDAYRLQSCFQLR